MIARLHAVILGVFDTGESSGVAHVLTAERGPLSVIAKGARRGRAPVAASLQPLALAELTVHMHEDSEMVTLREASAVHAHPEFAREPARLACGALVAEVAAASCLSHQPAHEMLETLVRALDDLAAAPSGSIDARGALWMLRILAASGHAPIIDPVVLSHRGTPRPRMFWLEVSRGRVTLDGSQPSSPPQWPLLPAREGHFPLPPEAVRLIHESTGERGDRAASNVPPPGARQLLRGLVLHAEHSLERRIRSARFWESLSPGGERR